MQHRFLLALFSALCCAGPGQAQQDLGSRLRTVPSAPKHLRYDLRTRAVRPVTGPQVFFGPNKLYNNTCPQGIFVGLSPGDQILDAGQIPSTSNAFAGLDLTNCQDAYNVNGFQVFYCSNQPSNDLNVTFHEQYDPCTDILASPVTAGFAIAGLPGSSSGGALCYVVDIDLEGTSLEFTMVGDGNGVWDNNDMDSFGYTFEFTNITGTAVGPVVAGGTIIVGSGCDWGVDTIFEQADPTGTSPAGTGWGSTDAFGLQDTLGGMFVGCFFFGGYPNNEYGSYHMVIYTDDDCTGTPAALACDGTAPAPCPCGNNSSSNVEGCLNSSGTGGGILAALTGSLTTGLFIDASYPAGNGSLLLTNASGSLISVGTFDGHACVAGGPRVLPGADNGAAPDVTAMDGIRTIGDVWAAMNVVAPGFVTAGSSYDMQAWYRDVLCGPPPAPCPSPCGTNANFTTAVSVLATP